MLSAATILHTNRQPRGPCRVVHAGGRVDCRHPGRGCRRGRCSTGAGVRARGGRRLSACDGADAQPHAPRRRGAVLVGGTARRRRGRAALRGGRARSRGRGGGGDRRARAHGAGLHVAALMPEGVALPFQPGAWTLWWGTDQAIVRDSAQSAFALDADNVAFVLKRALIEAAAPPETVWLIDAGAGEAAAQLA